ncbi:class I SAM-dependent methyltransferase [Mycobacteroides franklinii]|uniref:Mg-protoporphyrin IX methyl transferase n=1 Tax=Mycobacteroides franklinii TaxID=948102 RepID=A0A4R8QTM7_9MYCO|nr:class I SAM-dependent methyltransferase [Mycobacteroides franklinii]TDZ44465.1 Mg-protoporphyrin IX methyl transferase [Mycobacteroides franklinii]TDZ47352.1 Mg-protoporphyrin IX methyl transferase [Mycobacteroides franklinii]TDZ58018.1 Mg-protoporphyrin IX methyl transferase [Mycobacteroides franklinii]TDZ64960.1 Mg-protoporphyrin IX methyl transferase [Mycobacteroides franklinii]TDZ71358.1 Mg-protoporphyrin IX methyl transferase [Mycobacteroides franklinii]
MTQVIDWDGAYREEDKPAWNIGEPQPEFTALIDQDGVVRGEVLDAGCGYAELTLALAARGHTVVGIDLTPTAVEAASAAAAERGLHTATFQQADISSFTGYDGRFSTIFDSGLLHALPAELRDGYLQSAHRAAAPGASFYILAFGTGAFPDHDGPAPTQFSEHHLRDVVSKHWHIESIRPARLQAGTGQASAQLPGHLVTARKV